MLSGILVFDMKNVRRLSASHMLSGILVFEMKNVRQREGLDQREFLKAASNDVNQSHRDVQVGGVQFANQTASLDQGIQSQSQLCR